MKNCKIFFNSDRPKDVTPKKHSESFLFAKPNTETKTGFASGLLRKIIGFSKIAHCFLANGNLNISNISYTFL